ncbi:MAG: gamma-glutamyltransferase [Nitrospirae bacterium]|nr:gamma-glutamyltransferase [Nitrospirota bacterium]
MTKWPKTMRRGLLLLTVMASILFPNIIIATTHDHSIGIPGVHGGVVATTEAAAARVGANILRQGGNAIDAAAAVAFALNVVEPQSSGIGGGGFMMMYLAKTKETLVLDSRETAPALATVDMFLDTQSEAFPYAIRSTSGIAVGVPGMIRGIAMALDRWGTFSLAAVLAPAIQMASDGVRISQRLANDIQEGMKDGRLGNERTHSSYDVARNVFAPQGIPPQPGDLLVQLDLANTFRLLAKEGPEAFYSGKIAEAIVATQHHARKSTHQADQKKLQGRMTINDLANYQPVIRQPVEAMYRGYRIQSSPPPSSGGLTVLHILKLLERFPLGDHSQGFGFGSTRTLNVMIEAMRLAFADRAVWMGDEDFVDVPAEGLLNTAYIESRSAFIHPDTRQELITAGNPLPFDSASESQSVHIQETLALPEEGLNTTHFTIIDQAGNIVTYTNTIESKWGTGLMVPGFGFLLNNELTDFNAVPTADTDPKHFNPGANDVAPGKRPRSSMAPTIVFHHNQPIAAYGSPGGSTIINSVVNITLNLIDHKMPIQEAIDAPRLSQTSANGDLALEKYFSLKIEKQLEELGHQHKNHSFQTIGAVQAIVIDETTGTQFGGADRRRGGSVMSLKHDRSSYNKLPAN